VAIGEGRLGVQGGGPCGQGWALLGRPDPEAGRRTEGGKGVSRVDLQPPAVGLAGLQDEASVDAAGDELS
jgi:hypothetical protein